MTELTVCRDSLCASALRLIEGLGMGQQPLYGMHKEDGRQKEAYCITTTTAIYQTSSDTQSIATEPSPLKMSSLQTPTRRANSTVPCTDLTRPPLRIPQSYQLNLVPTDESTAAESTFEDANSDSSAVYRFSNESVSHATVHANGWRRVIVIAKLPPAGLHLLSARCHDLDAEVWTRPAKQDGVYISHGNGTFRIGDTSLDSSPVLWALASANQGIRRALAGKKDMPNDTDDVGAIYTSGIEVLPTEDIHHMVKILPDGSQQSLIGQRLDAAGPPHMSDGRGDIGKSGKWSVWALDDVASAKPYGSCGGRDGWSMRCERCIHRVSSRLRSVPGTLTRVLVRAADHRSRPGRCVRIAELHTQVWPDLQPIL